MQYCYWHCHVSYAGRHFLHPGPHVSKSGRDVSNCSYYVLNCGRHISKSVHHVPAESGGGEWWTRQTAPPGPDHLPGQLTSHSPAHKLAQCEGRDVRDDVCIVHVPYTLK